MEAQSTNRFLKSFTAACLLAGFLFFWAGPQASATACRTVQQEESGCCGQLDYSSGCDHDCCEAETPVPAFPARISGQGHFTALVSTDSTATGVIPVAWGADLAPRPAKPRQVLSFAELVLQESLLSHAPPAEVL